jgi:Rha family phage regulatory protein
MNQVVEKNPIVYARGNSVVANSRDVAEFFGKEHRNVMRAIDNLIAMEPELALNFERKQILIPIDNGGHRHIRSFDMDRDGFSLLAMGFTGKPALHWKLRYISAFNTMEAALRRAHDAERNDLPSAADNKVFGLSVSKVNSVARIVSVANAIYGPEAARALWEAEPGLPRLADKAVSALAGTADDDPVGCFRHLMRASAGNGRTVGQVLSLALHDKPAARALKDFGIAVDPREAPGFVAFANGHDFLARVFAETQWVGDWRIALAQLPGARPSRGNIAFGEGMSRAVLISRGEVLALLNPASALN